MMRLEPEEVKLSHFCQVQILGVISEPHLGRSIFYKVHTAAPAGGRNIVVTWNGSESGSGVQGYEVRYKQGNGSWTNWLSNVPYTSTGFAGTAGYTYTFQIQATDNAGNKSLWVQSSAVKIERVTKYYLFSGSRVAMRQGSVVRMRICMGIILAPCL